MSGATLMWVGLAASWATLLTVSGLFGWTLYRLERFASDEIADPRTPPLREPPAGARPEAAPPTLKPQSLQARRRRRSRLEFSGRIRRRWMLLALGALLLAGVLLSMFTILAEFVGGAGLPDLSRMITW